jgi:hypothetical protein
MILSKFPLRFHPPSPWHRVGFWPRQFQGYNRLQMQVNITCTKFSNFFQHRMILVFGEPRTL